MNRTPELVNSPLDNVYITQSFGEDFKMANGKWAYRSMGLAGHNGVDFRTRFVDSPLGRRYGSVLFKGKVISAGNDGGYGLALRVEHRNGTQTIYGHLTRIYVQVGDTVTPEDRAYLTGNSGFSTAPHLHVGVRGDNWRENYDNGYFGWEDPMPYLLGHKSLDPDENFGLIVDMDFAKKWAGWLIVLPKVHGELWHVHPTTFHRTYLGKIEAEAGARLAREQAAPDGGKVRGWVGMTAEDIAKIPVA